MVDCNTLKMYIINQKITTKKKRYSQKANEGIFFKFSINIKEGKKGKNNEQQDEMGQIEQDKMHKIQKKYEIQKFNSFNKYYY